MLYARRMSFTLITGASAGIGEATARLLAQNGRNLILIARRADRLTALKAELLTSGVDVQTHVLDVTDAKAVDALFTSLSNTEIDAVINNAGAAVGKDRLESAMFEDLEAMIDLNVTAFLRIARCSLPLLRRTKGHLVNLGSIAGLETYDGGVTYCATKHFVHAASKGLRAEVLGSGMRITEISPGAVETEFSLVRFKGDAEKADAVYAGFDPLQAQDVAEAIWFALSRPAHVDIQHMLIMPTAQASVSTIAKD